MTNSDNTYGVHNKQSKIWTQEPSIYTIGSPKTITLSNPLRIVTTGNHDLSDSDAVAFADIQGTTEVNDNSYFAKVIDSTTFDIYSDASLSTTVDGTGFTALSESNSDRGQMTVTEIKKIFANTGEAIDYFLTSDGKAVFNECATSLQWALVNDSDGDATNLKHTIAYGTKGTNGIAEEDDWAELFTLRIKALQDEDGFGNQNWSATSSNDHLF